MTPAWANRFARGTTRRIITTAQQWSAALGLPLVLGFSAGLLALLLFGYVASEVLEGDSQALDTAVLLALRQLQSPLLDGIMRGLSVMGSEALAALLVLVLGWLCWRRRWDLAASLLAVTAGAQLLNSVLKDLFQRTRPAPVLGFLPAQSFSFPSGHAMVAAAFYLFLAYLGWHVLRGRARILWSGSLLALILLIGLSRLYLGVHYLTDVLAGYAAGLTWVVTIIIGRHLLLASRSKRL